MRFIQTLPVLGFALASASNTLNRAGLVMDAPVRRQVDVVSGVFTKVSSDVTALDTAITSFSGDGSGLTSASNTLLADIKSGTTTISNSQPLDLTGATGIATSVTGLNSTISKTIDDLIAKKSAIVSAGLGGQIYQSLVDQQSASKALSDATTSKAPTALQSVAAQLSQGILDSLARGVAAYQDQQGQSGSSAPAGSSSAAAPSSSAVASSSAAASTSQAAPTTAGGAATSAAPAPTSKSGGYSTTAGAPPASFTGAANVQSPMIGMALAAAGLVAAL